MFASKEKVVELKSKYPAGTHVELIHMGEDPQGVPDGTIGTVIHVDDMGIVHVNWRTGSTLGVLPGVDAIRPVTAKVIVRKPGVKFFADSFELAKWANETHRLAGGKGDVFSAFDFPERLRGHHCDCGVTEDGYSAGEFELLPLESEEVREGGKAYMRCIKCGGYSHL